MGSFLFVPSETLLNSDFARNKEFTLEVRYVLFVVLKRIEEQNNRMEQNKKEKEEHNKIL